MISATGPVPDQDTPGNLPSTDPQNTTGDNPIQTPQPLFTGSCFCRAITLTLSSLSIMSYPCHCIDCCRRLTSSSFAHNSVSAFISLIVSTGADEKRGGDPTAEPEVDSVLHTFGTVGTGRRWFCGVCGSGLFLFGKVATREKCEMVVVPAGVIDGSHEDKRLRLMEEGFCKRRETWMADVEGTELFAEW